MKAIVAADANWGIGSRNELLVSIPNDMKFFREKTSGNVIVMGRRTLESFPGGRPLKNRLNIILTRNPGYQVKGAGPAIGADEVIDSGTGAAAVHSVDELMKYLDENCKGREVFCIGGESIYRQLLPYVDVAYVTKIDRSYEADAHFPNLDENPDFELAEESEEMTYFDMTYRFLTYKRKKTPAK